MAVVSALVAKVDNLTATVSGLSTEFAAFKNQQHTLCSETSTVASTPSLASGAQQGQGESAVCQHSLCDPPTKKDKAAGQCATAAAPTPRMDTPAKPVKGATRQPRSLSGMAPAPPASESKSPVADCEEDAAGEWTLVSRKKKRCYSPIPARTASPEPDQGHLKTASPKPDQGNLKTASPEPDQGHLMAAMQMLMEQMSRLTQEVDGLKTQMQHHRDER